MSHVRVTVQIGEHEATIQLPVRLVHYANRPHTKDTNNVEAQVQAATAKVMAVLGMERQTS